MLAESASTSPLRPPRPRAAPPSPRRRRPSPARASPRLPSRGAHDRRPRPRAHPGPLRLDPLRPLHPHRRSRRSRSPKHLIRQRPQRPQRPQRRRLPSPLPVPVAGALRLRRLRSPRRRPRTRAPRTRAMRLRPAHVADPRRLPVRVPARRARATTPMPPPRACPAPAARAGSVPAVGPVQGLVPAVVVRRAVPEVPVRRGLRVQEGLARTRA